VIWDKEDSVVLLLSGRTSSAGQTSNFTLFLGDESTDESSFKLVDKRGGASIFVGETGSRTAARYFLRSPGEVAIFLRKVAEIVGVLLI
jgi:trehalose-phosphatase